MSKENDEIAAIRERFEAAIYKAYGKPELICDISITPMSATNDELARKIEGLPSNDFASDNATFSTMAKDQDGNRVNPATMSTTNDEQAPYGAGMFPEHVRDLYGPEADKFADGLLKAAKAIMDTPAERAPMLSSHEFDAMCAKAIEDGDNEVERVFNSAASVFEFFESLITKGVLSVVKKSENIGAEFICSSCRIYLCDATMRHGDVFTHTVNFCPGCGAEIVKP